MYDVIIIGSGPAGLTAGIYTTRASLKTLIIAGSKWGGQLQLTTLVENYPGFPDGIQGPDLMTAMKKQAEKFGTEIVDADFKSGDFSATPFKVSTSENTYEGKSVIIATGADTRWLGAKGEEEKIGRGVSSCAPCDAPFFKDKNVIVVGGGDSAMEEALVLTKFAKEVTLIHRRDAFRASQIMQDKVKNNPKIKVLFNSEITEVLGQDRVTGVKISNNKTGEVTNLPIDGVFVAIGHIPNTNAFKGIHTDEGGFIKVYDHTKTNIDGIFVAGDVHDNHYKQAITAAGFGCMASLEAEKWLREK
ncbi:MAG: thioredoxin-disulfide reductase [Candidatus Levybacteria bacterium]|nr:thioredoxin-disulfide reductase [Candidatus Levybacteria bacterium]